MYLVLTGRTLNIYVNVCLCVFMRILFHNHKMKLILLILLLFVILSFISVREYYTDQCHFQADAGYVCPLTQETSTYKIIQYNQAFPEVQSVVIKHLKKEFGDFYSDRFVRKNWSSGDVFYVMVDKSETRFIGCVAVDRRNFYPYISELYVVPNERRNGYATKLLKFGEEYTKSLSFYVAKLWCDKELVGFYKKRGYTIEEIKDNTYMMRKTLS